MVYLQTLFPNDGSNVEKKLELPFDSTVFKFWTGIPSSKSVTLEFYPIEKDIQWYGCPPRLSVSAPIENLIYYIAFNDPLR